MAPGSVGKRCRPEAVRDGAVDPVKHGHLAVAAALSVVVTGCASRERAHDVRSLRFVTTQLCAAYCDCDDPAEFVAKAPTVPLDVCGRPSVDEPFDGNRWGTHGLPIASWTSSARVSAYLTVRAGTLLVVARADADCDRRHVTFERELDSAARSCNETCHMSGVLRGRD